MRRIKTTAIVLCAIMLCSGCSGSDAADYEFVSQPENEISFQNIVNDDSTLLISAFTVMDDSRTAVLAYRDGEGGGSVFAVYENGRLSSETEISPDYNEICYNSGKNCFYSFDAEKKQIHIMDENFQFSEVLAENVDAAEIKNMDIADDKLYYLTVPKDSLSEDNIEAALDEKTGYMDFGEKAYCVDLNTKEKKDLGIENVICQSYSNDTLFYYTCRGGRYSLDIYDRGSGSLKSAKSMDDVGYIYSFAVIGENMYFINGERLSLAEKNLNTGSITVEQGETFILRNSDFEVYKDRLIYLDRSSASILLCGGSSGTAGIDSGLAPYSGTKLVMHYFNPRDLPIRSGDILSESGVSVSVDDTLMLDEELKLKLLAGDSDIDIYCFSSSFRIGRDVREICGYVPLTDPAIVEEREQYFDWIADYTVNENGDIWCVPLFADTPAAFYIPENLKAVGAEAEDLKSFDGFFDVLEKIKKQNVYTFDSGSSLNFTDFMVNRYNVNYGYLDYDTDVFRNMFERMYSGWVIWSDPNEGKSEHPLFNNFASSFTGDIDKKPKAVKLSSISAFPGSVPEPGEWRAAGLPYVSSPEEKTPFTIHYAVINPFSKNKEAAEAYLGYIAENGMRLRSKKTMLFKDKGVYGGVFDASAPYFEELYKLYENGAVWEELLTVTKDQRQSVLEYQLGEITLDEYIADLERKAEMTVNE